MIPIAKYTFNTSNAGTTSANGVIISGWLGSSQDGSTVNTIVTHSGTNGLASNSPYGLWKQNYNNTVTYTDCDFTAILTLNPTWNPNGPIWMSARAQTLSALVGTGYGVIFTPNAGDGFGYVQFYKACGDTAYVGSTIQIPIFAQTFKARLTIVGLVQTAYINDVLIGSWDATGAVACGVDYTSGFLMIGPGFTNIIEFDAGDLFPNANLMT